jgi:hypothetical protein
VNLHSKRVFFLQVDFINVGMPDTVEEVVLKEIEQEETGEVDEFELKIRAVLDRVVEQRTQNALARSQQLGLVLMRDVPEDDFRPPENVLFVCKLNRVTEDSDLETIFSRWEKNLHSKRVKNI